MNFFDRSERLEMIEGQLCRIVTAYGKDKAHKGEKMDVLKHFEDGNKYIRNIEYKNAACGWLIAWPGYIYQNCCWGYKSEPYTAEVDEWYHCSNDFKGFSLHYPSKAEENLILQKYPEFKWIFKKANLTTEEIFHILPCWKKAPQQVEMLLGAGYRLLALNKNIYQLKNPRPVLEWLRRNPGNKYITLAEIQKSLKWNIDLDELHRFENSRIPRLNLPYDCWKYMQTVLLPNDQTKSETSCSHHYKDYLDMAKKAGHNINEKYWRFPKLLREAHAKVMRECEKIDAMKAKAEREQKQKDYTAAIKTMVKKMLKVEKMNVFIPATIEQIEHQANALNQCLIRCDYIKKVIKGECFLVFITKAGKPYATCELKKSKRGNKFSIGQFYGNEKLKNYLAKADAKKALDEWAAANKVNIIGKEAA